MATRNPLVRINGKIVELPAADALGGALAGLNGDDGMDGGAITIRYTFDTTTTDADPGGGKLRLNNATQNTATTIYADLADSSGADWTTALDTFDDSTNTVKGSIRLVKSGDATKFLTFNVTAVTSASGYRKITVSNTASSASSPFSNGDAILLCFDRAGDAGADGADGTGGGAFWGTLTVPLASAFTTFGTGIVVTDKSDRMQIQIPSGTVLRGQTLNSISTPYTIDIGCGWAGNPANADATYFGIAVSNGTAYRTFYAGSVGFGTNNVVNRFSIDSWTNSTTFSATVRTAGILLNPYAYFLRITDSGTNRKFYISSNGKDFVEVYSEATNTFVTPTKFAMAGYNNSANTVTAKANVQHWLVSSSVLGDAS